MTIQQPYVLFLGDAPDPLAAKVAQGIKDWRPGLSVGQSLMTHIPYNFIFWSIKNIMECYG